MLDIDVTRNGNNLKLKVKSEFSLSMGLMVINHSNPYIHSTTVLCDNYSIHYLPCLFTMSKQHQSDHIYNRCNFVVDNGI